MYEGGEKSLERVEGVLTQGARGNDIRRAVRSIFGLGLCAQIYYHLLFL